MKMSGFLGWVKMSGFWGWVKMWVDTKPNAEAEEAAAGLCL